MSSLRKISACLSGKVGMRMRRYSTDRVWINASAEAARSSACFFSSVNVANCCSVWGVRGPRLVP